MKDLSMSRILDDDDDDEDQRIRSSKYLYNLFNITIMNIMVKTEER